MFLQPSLRKSESLLQAVFVHADSACGSDSEHGDI